MFKLARISVVAGAVILLVSILWWWVTYREVIQYNYVGMGEASFCLVTDTDICRLARALCRGAHPLEIINYRNLSLWLGVAALSLGVLTWPRPRLS
jgi:hypothetical protein